MNIQYKNIKHVECYKNFVLNPDDRRTQKMFAKTFGNNLMGAAKKLHERLIENETIETYNSIFGNTPNRIEIKRGCKNKECLVLKVRVNDSYRKFFNIFICDNEPLLTELWDGGRFLSYKNYLCYRYKQARL